MNDIKKIITFVLCLVLAFSVIGCGSNQESAEKDNNLYTGSIIAGKEQQRTVCPTCNGTGIQAHPCVACKGTGEEVCSICEGKGYFHLDTICPICNGTGGSEEDPCKFCNGTGIPLCQGCGGTGVEPCGLCNGTGIERRSVPNPCIECNGKGYIFE